MANNPHTQAEALTYVKNKERELMTKLLQSEAEISEFLNWAELPMTKRVREKFKEQEEKFLQYLKSNKWQTEAEARGLCYLLVYLGILDKLVLSYKKMWEKIQAKKQKEG